MNHSNCSDRVTSGRRQFIQISALSTFDGSVVDYRGVNGWRRIWVWLRRGSLRNGYHIQGRQQGRKLTNPDTGSQWQKITILNLLRFGNWNEYNLKALAMIHWRESLVPAAAVIPAPVAYIKVAAVKKLVVGFLTWCAWPAPFGGVWRCALRHPCRESTCPLLGGAGYLHLLLWKN